MVEESNIDEFWRAMKTQSRLMIIPAPPSKEKLFYTYDPNEDKVWVFHTNSGIFSGTKSDFEKVHQDVKKILEEKGHQVLFDLDPQEMASHTIMRDYFKWQSRVPDDS